MKQEFDALIVALAERRKSEHSLLRAVIISLVAAWIYAEFVSAGLVTIPAGANIATATTCVFATIAIGLAAFNQLMGNGIRLLAVVCCLVVAYGLIGSPGHLFGSTTINVLIPLIAVCAAMTLRVALLMRNLASRKSV